MARPGEAMLRVTFGPTRSPLVARAVSNARARASELAEVEPGVWRVGFRLGGDERSFGEASQLVWMVLGWRSTTVEVQGSPELPRVALQMLVCAREWLRSAGACRARFPVPAGWPKCRGCPLYDAGWAAESAPQLGFASDLLPGVYDAGFEIPDQLPDEWEEE